jgi:hypothetical protein
MAASFSDHSGAREREAGISMQNFWIPGSRYRAPRNEEI